MHFDLHMHSVNSHDGFYSEKELIARAKEKKLDLIALCDHNTTAGIPAIMKEGSKQNLSVIAGIELDTLFEGHEIHILGYNIDPSYPYFADLSKKIDNLEKKALKERIEKVIDYFHLQPESERLMNVAAVSTTPFASVIQDILSDSRYREITAFDPYRKEGGNVFFFWDYCSAEGPCHVSVDYPGLKENIQHIHNAGGIAIIAHPYHTFDHNEPLLDRALKTGIAGIEAFSNYHSAQQNHFYAAYCDKKDCLATFGSDFHGPFKPQIEMGDYHYDLQEEWRQKKLTQFLSALKK